MSELGDRLTPNWSEFGGGNSGQSSDAAHNSQKSDKKRPTPFFLRLSFDEKQKLIEDAGRLSMRQSISAYIKERLFDSDTPVRQARGLKAFFRKLRARASLPSSSHACPIKFHSNGL